ncbi:MAG: glutathione S-transferase family protein [Kangiellaceae bacterium]|nr:glutathione S-transferase family protein [Kangiellaceae bacterium]
MMSNYTLYGTEFSLYSGKARAYLDYKSIPYDEILSTVRVYKDTIVPNTGVKFIPVVKTPDNEYLQDTSNIIDQLEVKFPEKSVYPSSPKQRLVSLLLELYGDEWLLIPAMHYRWNNKDRSFIFKEFGKVVSPKSPGFVRKFLGKKVGDRFKSMVPALGITEKTIPAIEQWFEKGFLVDLDKHFEAHSFLLGDIPCIADFGFYGPLFAHMYREPNSFEMLNEQAPNVVGWIKRMQNSAELEGDFIADDEIPETLFPILANLFDTHWPVLEDTAVRLSEWYSRETNDIHITEPTRVPRRLGMHQFTINGVTEQRMVLPHSQWMMQRPIHLYSSFSSNEKKAMEPFLKKINALYAMRFNLDVEVSRLDNKFVIL